MPQDSKTKFIIVSNTKIAGKHVDKGSILELDPDSTRDAALIAQLNHAGRIAVASPDVVKEIKEELAKEAADKKAAAATP